MLGDNGLQEFTYKQIEDKKNVSFKATNAWLGITDKYWAATLIPDTKAPIQAQFSYNQTGTQKTYQTDYLGDAQTIAPGATGTTNARLFAGAKEVAVVDGYEKQLGAQPLRPADRLGLVLFHHQADVLVDRLDLPARRQFRHRHPADHRPHQGDLLPARQQVLRLDGEDEGGAAGDGRDPRALSPTTR